VFDEGTESTISWMDVQLDWSYYTSTIFITIPCDATFIFVDQVLRSLGTGRGEFCIICDDCKVVVGNYTSNSWHKQFKAPIDLDRTGE
jgi:hypothetical protein